MVIPSGTAGGLLLNLERNCLRRYIQKAKDFWDGAPGQTAVGKEA